MPFGTRRPSRERASGPEPVRASAPGVAGVSYESLERREETIEHLRREIALAPRAGEFIPRLAFLHEKARRLKEAVEILEQGRHSQAYIRLAEAYRNARGLNWR